MDTKIKEDYDMDDLTNQVEKMQLPKRDDSENVDGYGIKTRVFMNVFKLSTKDAPKTIYKYELTFTMTKANGDEFQLHNALQKVNDFVRSNKRNTLIFLTRVIHEENKEFFRQQQMNNPDDVYWRSCCAFDCGCTYYTGVNLPNNSGEISEESWKSNQWTQYFIGNRKGPIKWDLVQVETFSIEGENAKSPQALQFFQVLAMQTLNRNEDIDVKPDAAYLAGGDFTKDHKQLRKGIVTTSKVMGDNVCIQLDSKISLFFKAESMLEYLRKFSGRMSESDLERYLNDRVQSRKLRKELVNLPLRVRHLPSRKTFEFKGFHTDNAVNTTFKLKDDSIISVADYIEKQYKYKLKFPRLPLVIEKNRGGNSYHAIECLDIADGTRVSNQKMSKEAQENMISKSCRAPGQLGKDLEESRRIAALEGTRENKYLTAFNVKTTGEFACLDAKLLSKPKVIGMGNDPQINDRGQISYTKGGFRFADPAKPSRPITLVSLGNAMREEDCRNMRDALKQFGSDFGMSIEFSNIRDPAIFGGQIEPLREFMASQQGKTSMFFFITKEKMDESHYMVKKLEQELGVVTQLISAKTAGDFLRKMRTTQFNVMAKMNQKLGGVVANPEVPPDLKISNPDAYARAVKDWFPNRMFVGLTLSHAGSQSFADRVVGEEVREPTCVGMAFTMKQPGKRSAMSWFQEKRKATIDDLTRHFIRALDIYAESNGGKMPTSILIFRKGMSEGELKKAAFEMHQVKEAIIAVSKRPGHDDYRPTVQCLVCMGNTSDRLFYQNGSENVPAGTCIDKEGCNPDRVEFLIVPHTAIKGTAKAVRCTLVTNDKGKVGRRLEYSEIQSVYHAMCYLNGVAASPTRLPVPLADSEKAAERQMNNFKESMRNGDDTMSMCSGRSGSGVTHDGTRDFYKNLSDQFDHKFKDNQYYA